MHQINLKTPPVTTGGFVAKSLPDLACLHTWAGDVELVVFLNRDQCATLSDVLKSRLATFAFGGASVKKVHMHNLKNQSI